MTYVKAAIRSEIDQFLEDYFLEKILQRGNEYSNNGNVQSVSFHEDKTVEAIVTGSYSYDVTIDLNSLEYSACDCPYEDWCKHIVAVLLEVKEQLAFLDLLRPENISLLNQSYTNSTEVETQLRNVLVPYCTHSYRRLTSGQFLNDDRTTKIANSFPLILKQLGLDQKEHEQLLLLLLFIEQLFSMAKKYETYTSFQRRFSFLFVQLTETLSEKIEYHSTHHHPTFHPWFSHRVIDLYLAAKNIMPNPWETVLMKWILAEKDESIKKHYLEVFLDVCKSGDSIHKQFIIVTSVIALHCEQGAKSLALLRSINQPILPCDLTMHFTLLKNRDDWETMKRWFELFGVNWKLNQLESIRSFYEEMLLKTENSTENLEKIWSTWLTHPTFTIFKQRIDMVKLPQVREATADFLLDKLEVQLFTVKTETIYYQILLNEKRFERGITTLIRRERDPQALTKAKRILIEAATEVMPEKVLALLHQFIERLIQKKSRSHYEEACDYINQLKAVYSKLYQLDRYHLYISRLKKQYKSYRALIQELNKIEQLV